MTDNKRKETPPYISPVFETPVPPPDSNPPIDMSAMIALRQELSLLDTSRIMMMVETEVLESKTRKDFREAAIQLPRTNIILMAAQLLTYQRAKNAREKIRKASRDRLKVEAIAIGPNDVLPVAPSHISPQPFPATRDPDETIPAPAFPVPETPADPLYIEAMEYRAKQYHESTDLKKTTTIPPRELDPLMPPTAPKQQYPKSTPIEFLPKPTLSVKTSYSFVLDLQKERAAANKRIDKLSKELQQYLKQGEDKKDGS